RQGRGDPLAFGSEHGNVLVTLERIARGHHDAGPPDETARSEPAASGDGDHARRTLRDGFGQMAGESGEGIFGGSLRHWDLQAVSPICHGADDDPTGRMARSKKHLRPMVRAEMRDVHDLTRG